MTDFVRFEDVSLTYGGQQSGTMAVRNINLGLERGEFAAVVGPSGCGKTSLLKLVSGLLRPSTGRVQVNGKPVLEPLHSVGMAFQNATLLPWRNTLENVLLPLEVAVDHKRRYRKEPGPYLARARDLLASVGLAGFEQHLPWQLSGGMQQRAALCRALIHDPEILLLDEPFAALDAFTREDLWLSLQTLWTKRRCTVILVTHDLREAAFLANTIYVMSARPGELVGRLPVDLPRPRGIEDSYSATFTDLIHQTRTLIGQVREV